MTRLAQTRRPRTAAVLAAVTAGLWGSPAAAQTYTTPGYAGQPARPAVYQAPAAEPAWRAVQPVQATTLPAPGPAGTSGPVVVPGPTAGLPPGYYPPAGPPAVGLGVPVVPGPGQRPDSFWSLPAGDDGPGPLDRVRGLGRADDDGGRPDWRNLPRMLGDQGRGSAGANVPTDIASGAPDGYFQARTAVANVPGGTASNNRLGVEFAANDRTAFGATAGVDTATGGAAAGLAPSLYAKRVVGTSDDGFWGLGFGGTLPASKDAPGNIFPWAFGATRVTGDTWVQGLTGVSVPFTSRQETFGYTDVALVMPVYGRRAGPRGVRVYFMPELHANYRIANGGQGSPGFVLNSTIGFGVRYRGFDIQAGMAFPLLNDRFYDYESMLRISYRF